MQATFHPQYGIRRYGLQVHRDGVLADVDGNDAQARLETATDPPFVVFDRSADHDDLGLYSTAVSSVESTVPGLYRLVFTYALDTVPQIAVEDLLIEEVGPAYRGLLPEMQGVVERVWWRFADLFDSPLGGPHLATYFQTAMNRSRMAQIALTAIGNLNTSAQPTTSYDATNFPLTEWGGLLELATYIETIKHLMRSYVEQPEVAGVGEARLDRRDYLQRWGSILEMEMPTYERQYEQYRMAHMGLGAVRVLVAGGVYGNYGPTRLPNSAAARPHYWSRFY